MELSPERQAESEDRADAKFSSNGARISAAQSSATADGRSQHCELAPGVHAQDIVANLTEAFIVLDRDWRIVYANHEAARLNRKRREEFLGRTQWEEWPASVGTQVEREYRRAMEERVPVHFEIFYLGYNTWLDIHAYPCGPGIAVHCRDISDRKRLETKLLNREKELTDFIENAAVALHWVGADGTILWANEAELKLLGYTREEYIGHNIMDFHVDEPVIMDILHRLRQRQELDEYEARLRCKDGSIRHVAITSNVYWEDGRFVHTRCFTRDITEQRRTAELQEHLAAIVESSDDAIISKDLNGIIRSWNRGAERIFGYRPEEIIGKPVTTLAVPGRANEIPNIISRIRRGERIDHYETRRQTKDGRVLSVSLTVSPIRDASGEIIGASKIARDITERVRSEETLQKTNAALSRANADLEQFAYSASHDLQEPLRMVSIYSEMLGKKFGGQLGATGDEYIRYTIQGAQRMQQLLKDLLVYTHASTLGEEPTADVDAKEALERALSNLHAATTSTGASVTHGPLPRVRMHAFQLEQMFQNLIGNAIRYRREEAPEVHITAQRQDAQWLFSVRDNGIGIDPKYKERIFGMFKRLHSIADYPGTGMGLAICQRIIHRAGGRIWVESELGRGSTFFFTIPIGQGH
jgi:PAS domain S-box-containing protein